MQKIEYKKIPFSILAFPELGMDWWIYSYCPTLEEKWFMLFYRPVTPIKWTRLKKIDTESEEFIKFYKIYPNKKARVNACRSWNNLAKIEQEDAMTMIPLHAGYWKQNKTAMNLIPHPATWINAKRWKDDLGEKVKPIDVLKKEEKDREVLQAKAKIEQEQSDKDREEANQVSLIKADLEVHSKERYQAIVDEAIAMIPEDQRAVVWYKAILDQRIRGIIYDKFVKKC